MKPLTNNQVARYLRLSAETIYAAKGSYGVALQRDAFRQAIQRVSTKSSFKDRESRMFMLDGAFADVIGGHAGGHHETDRETLSYLFLFVSEFYRTGGFSE